MQILDGTLTIEVIPGKRGDFCVGTLLTSIGEFKVKDAALDQFERGSYKGRFTVEKIYMESTKWRNGWFTNLMAKIALDGYQINEEEESPAAAPSAQAEPDSIDDSVDSTPSAQAEPAIPDSDKSVSKPQAATSLKQELDSTTSNPVNDPDEKLFGIELYPLFKQRAKSIALDNTIDREQFRMQRDRLKANGYRFDTKDQKWHLN